MLKRSLTGLLAIAFVVWAGGCGKKAASPQQTPAPQNAQQDAPPATAPQQAAAPPAASAPPETYDATVTVRTIDYLRGQVAQKNWASAREALKRVEERPLSPQQRQYVDTLKAQIPAGK